MDGQKTSSWQWLAGAVVGHLIITIVHGVAHSEAHVSLSRAGAVVVLVVIVAGPIAGLALTWRAVRIGSWLTAIAMAGSLLFGLVSHFMISSPDHVAHVAGPWRPVFATTAVLLALTEALGFGLAMRFALEANIRS